VNRRLIGMGDMIWPQQKDRQLSHFYFSAMSAYKVTANAL
jgi:hypothetical protein